MQVGIQLVRRALPGREEHEVVLRPHVQHRPQPRRVADAAPVGMDVVEAAEPVLDHVHVLRLRRVVRRGPEVGEDLLVDRVREHVLVRVREVAEGRQEERDPRRRAAARRPDDERDEVLAALDLEVRGVDPAREVVGDGQPEVHLPARVVEVVVVEVDRPVLARRAGRADRGTRPRVARHRARRHVHGATVKPVRPSVAHGAAVEPDREIPRGDEPGERARGAARAKPRRLRGLERAREDARALDLPVEVVRGTALAVRAARDEQRPRGSRRACPTRPLDGLARRGRLEVDGVDDDPGDAARRIVRGAHEVPAALAEGALAADGSRRERERDASGAVEVKVVAGPAHERLLARLEQRRPEPELDREAAVQAQRVALRDDDVRAERKALLAPGVPAVDRRRDTCRLETRAGGIVVAVDQPDEPGAVARLGAADHELDLLPGRDAQPARVADGLHGRGAARNPAARSA